MEHTTTGSNTHASGPRSSAEQGRRLARLGLFIAVGALAPIGAWLVLAPLSMAVVAPAHVKVDLNRRPVQHLEGGIVRAVLVRDGQQVAAGDPLLVLGDVGVDADRNRLAYRAMVERAGLARLESEQVRARSMRFPAELLGAAEQDERVRQALAKERALFETRRASLDSEVALMKTQRERIDEEGVALRAQIGQLEHSLALQRKDLESVRGLQRDSFISAARVSQLEAALADYAAKLEERRSELARAGQRMADIDLKIRSLQNSFVQGATDQLRMSVSRLSEIEQEMRKTQDAATRQVITAPAGGAIIDLKFTSPGAVVRPGEPIAEIVPHDASLMLEARIRPEEINHVHLGQVARIKFSALRYRNSAMVRGKVTYIAADRLVDKGSGQPYFTVLIAADAASIKAAGDLKLLAGMPAEVYIEGSKQTPLEYLMEPVTSSIRRAGRQL
jgi:HlyD family secretion protein